MPPVGESKHLRKTQAWTPLRVLWGWLILWSISKTYTSQLLQHRLSIFPRRKYIIFLIDLRFSTPYDMLTSASFQGFNFLELLSFDPTSIGSVLLDVDDQQLQPTGVVNQLRHMKDLLSTSIDTLVQDSDEIKHLLAEIQPQLLKVLQIKLCPAGHLPFFWAQVEKAHRRIEECCSHASLKADIAEKCRLVNDKKMALDAKTDTSASSQRLDLLERELEDLKERVRATERLIQDEKNFMAISKQEAEDLATQLKIELVELSILSRQIVSGEDKDDEAAIAKADRVRLEAIGTINEFLQKNAL
jgi:hypothetical protein